MLPLRHAPMSTLVGLLALLAGCTLPPTEPAPPSPPVVAPEPTPDPAQSEAFFRLIDLAERALTEDRLLTPEQDSAYRYFREAMAMAPGNPDAALGFERIVERYLQLVQLAIERQQWTQARSLLDRAAYVDPVHTGIASIRDQVEMLANAERVTLRLDRTGLRERRADIAAELVELGAGARRPNARVAIRAASDADARWIYEQLDRAPGERRIRGEIEIGLPAQVVLILLPVTGN